MGKPYVVGIDIGGTNTVFGIVDAAEQFSQAHPSRLRSMQTSPIILMNCMKNCRN